jgi:hypothetical protein
VTDGFVWKEYSGGNTSAALPIAYGVVNSVGTVISGTGNFTVSHSATGQFLVTVSGETYSNNTFVVTATAVTNSDRHTTVGDGGTGFLINVFNQAGTAVDNQFQFIVYKGSPSTEG